MMRIARTYTLPMCNFLGRNPLRPASIDAGRLVAVALRRVLGCLLLLALLAGVSAAQNGSIANYGTMPAGIAPGAPEGSSGLSSIENVSPYNGSVNPTLPLLKVGGRGVGYTMMARIKKTPWTVENRVYGYACGTESDDAPNCYLWDAAPRTQWWTPTDPGYSPGLLEGRRVGSETYVCPGSSGPVNYGRTFTVLTFTAPDGTEHHLYDEKHGGNVLQWDCVSNFPDPDRGRVFSSKDGSGLTFVADEAINDYASPDSMTAGGMFWPAGILKTGDGTAYRISWGRVDWMRDRHGNKMTFAYDTYSPSCGASPASRRVTKITDPLGREVNINYDAWDGTYGTHDQIIFNGVGGQQRVIRVSKTTLGNAFRPNSGYQVKNYTGLFPQLSAPNNPCTNSQSFNPPVISSVWLQDGVRRYQFFYNEYNELARLDLPTGGRVEYDYWAGVSGSLYGSPAYPSGQIGQKTTLGEPRIIIYRRLRERRLYPDAGPTPTLKTSYGRETGSAAGEYVQVDQLDPRKLDPAGNPTLMTRERHYYNGNAAGTLTSAIGTVQDGVADYMQGKELKTENLSTDGSDTVLRRVEQAWEPGNIYGARDGVTPWSGYLKEVVMSLLDTTTGQYKMSKQEFTYDQYNNLTDTYDYDFGTGAVGPLLRRSHTDYETAPVYTDALTGAHLRHLQKQQWVSSDAGGSAKLSLTTYGYDQFALTNYTSISGFDPAFGPGYTTRGDLTTVTRHADAAAGTGAVSTSSTYDIAGNVTSSIDARGQVTHFDYTDSYSDGVARNTYALPKTFTTPAPDPGGTFGSTTPLVSTKVYDFSTGAVTSVTDPNGKNTSYQYGGHFDRLTQVNLPGGGRTTHNYVDTHQCGSHVETRTLMEASGREIASWQFFDGLARPYLSETQENQDANNPYIRVDTRYDALGRVSQTSNPYRSAGCTATPNPPGLWTTTEYDALGRATKVTTPDGAKVTTDFAGNAATVTDPSNKVRRSVSDALGRLVRADEPNSSGALGSPDAPAQPTVYEYDATNNLRKVEQDGQKRYFMYDSLGRLIRAKNPEQAVNGGLALADTVTNNSQWSLAYSYDLNGNLYQQTDARGVTTTFGYDNLNRNTTVRYSDGTRGEDRYYDTEPNARGHLWRTGAAGDFTDQLERDASGRPTRNRQWFYSGGMWRYYDTTYSYDLGGAVTGQSYPSGHTTSYQYDAAGRVNYFGGNLGVGVSRAYASGILYSELGGRSQEQYGTATPVYNKSFYNVRGQLSEIRVATTPNDTFWNRGAIINHYSNLSWAGSGADNNGSLKRQEVYIPADDQISSYTNIAQFYGYDELNRLKSVEEKLGAQQTIVQEYVYDRWGNRTVNVAGSWGAGANKPYAVDQATNRLGVPAGQPGVMTYDNAGNLTTDTYGGNGSRAYDAGNRMTQETDVWGKVTGRYSYDGDGRRVRRTANGLEWWYVYGLGGELVAEYGASFPGTVQQEYGYRAGELLVTASGYGEQGLQADYFNGTNFDAPVMTRTDASVNFDWGGGGPGSGVGIDNFTVRWTGYVTPRFSETYTFYTQTDDGVRLWVDGQMLIDKWIDQAPTQWSGQITLQAGRRYQIRMEFYERGGGATARLLWSSPSQWTEAVPAGQLAPPEGGAAVRWLVLDQVGTPRMALDQTGSLSRMARQDYLPFGEEIAAGVAQRSTTQGYMQYDLRQGFTGYEKDWETTLNFAQHRYQSPAQGRFTGVDPGNAGANPNDPQSWNGYAYARNNPLLFVDPDGRKYKVCRADGGCEEMTDEQFNQMKNNPNNGELGVVVKGGTIYNRAENGDLVVVGLYQRTGFDDLSDFANGVIFGTRNTHGLVEQAPVAGKTAMLLWGGSVVLGAGIGAAAGTSGAVGLQALADHLALSINATRASMARELTRTGQQKLLSKLFGDGVPGVQQALANTRVPAGLTNEALVMYREIARRSIIEGLKNAKEVQTLRIQLIDKILAQRGIFLK